MHRRIEAIREQGPGVNGSSSKAVARHASSHHESLRRTHIVFAVPSRPTVFLLALLALTTPHDVARAQVLIVTPGCGKAGDVIGVTGSGWAEPDPLCDYFIYFDGTLEATQVDGLYGPPDTSIVIPSTGIGTHSVRVELRLREDGSLLQCRVAPLRVVSDNLDPWHVTSPFGHGLNANFDPLDVCDVTPCDSIFLIQVMHPYGIDLTGSARDLTMVELGLDDGTERDATRTPFGYLVDEVGNAHDPYSNGSDPHDSDTAGRQDGSPTPSSIFDFPGGFVFPSGIHEIVIDFEDNAFCGKGHDEGTFLGQLLWEYRQTSDGSEEVAIIQGQARNAPSAAFMNALDAFTADRGFELPSPSEPPPPTAVEDAPCD